MCTFRGALRLIVAAACCTITACERERAAELSAATASPEEPTVHAVAQSEVDYFPLSVGNRWRYRCSVEGEPQLEKQFEIVEPAKIAGSAGFKAIETVNGAPGDVYLYVDAQGQVLRAYSEAGEESEVIGAVSLQGRTSVGPFRHIHPARQSTTATGEIDVIAAATFDLDDPNLTPEQRSEWRARFFAPEIGLVAEADGLGGECELVEYELRQSDADSAPR